MATFAIMRYAFPQKEKLKSKKLIDLLFTEGKSVTVYPLKLIYLRTTLPENVKVQAGVTVSKRNFKSAVRRNRIKRLLRESYRLNKGQVFNNSDDTFAFLFLYLGKEMPNFGEIAPKMVELLHKFLIKEKIH